MHHATRRMHKPFADRRDAVGVACATGLAGVVHVAGKRNEARMRSVLVERLGVAAVADGTVVRREGMRRTEACAMCLMAADASVLRRRRDVRILARARCQDENCAAQK